MGEEYGHKVHSPIWWAETVLVVCIAVPIIVARTCYMTSKRAANSLLKIIKEGGR